MGLGSLVKVHFLIQSSGLTPVDLSWLLPALAALPVAYLQTDGHLGSSTQAPQESWHRDLSNGTGPSSAAPISHSEGTKPPELMGKVSTVQECFSLVLLVIRSWSES